MDACASGEAEKWKARETALLYRFILGGLASAYGVLGLVGSTYDQHTANWKSYLLTTWMPKKQFGKRSGVARRLLQAQANAVPDITPCSASGGFRTKWGVFAQYLAVQSGHPLLPLAGLPCRTFPYMPSGSVSRSVFWQGVWRCHLDGRPRFAKKYIKNKSRRVGSRFWQGVVQSTPTPVIQLPRPDTSRIGNLCRALGRN